MSSEDLKAVAFNAFLDRAADFAMARDKETAARTAVDNARKDWYHATQELARVVGYKVGNSPVIVCLPDTKVVIRLFSRETREDRCEIAATIESAV